MQYGFYRLHVPDPIYFRQDFRATIQQIGCASRVENRQRLRGLGRRLIKNGPGRKPLEITEEQSCNFEREDDWSSCSYFYLDRPESNLPDLMPLGQRIEGLMGQGPGD